MVDPFEKTVFKWHTPSIEAVTNYWFDIIEISVSFQVLVTDGVNLSQSTTYILFEILFTLQNVFIYSFLDLDKIISYIPILNRLVKFELLS